MLLHIGSQPVQVREHVKYRVSENSTYFSACEANSVETCGFVVNPVFLCPFEPSSDTSVCLVKTCQSQPNAQPSLLLKRHHHCQSFLIPGLPNLPSSPIILFFYMSASRMWRSQQKFPEHWQRINNGRVMNTEWERAG